MDAADEEYSKNDQERAGGPTEARGKSAQRSHQGGKARHQQAEKDKRQAEPQRIGRQQQAALERLLASARQHQNRAQDGTDAWRPGCPEHQAEEKRAEHAAAPAVQRRSANLFGPGSEQGERALPKPSREPTEQRQAHEHDEDSADPLEERSAGEHVVPDDGGADAEQNEDQPKAEHVERATAEDATLERR